MVKLPRGCRTFKQGLVTFLFLFVLVSPYSQDSSTIFRTVIGRNLAITIQTEIPYSPDLKIEMPQLEEPISIYGNPYIRSYRKEWITEGRREYQNFAEVRFQIKSTLPGIYEIPEIKILSEGSEMELSPLYLLAFRWDEYSNSYPLTVQWREPPVELYQGETVILMLNAQYTESILFPQSIQLSSPAGGTLERVSLPGDIDTLIMNDGSSIYKYPLESWIFSSLEAGTVRIPHGEVVIQDLTRPINALDIQILELPGSVQGTGAVGNFTREIEYSNMEYQLGQTMEIHVILSGWGNFPNIHMPDPQLQGWEIISRSEENFFQPNQLGGYRGNRQFSYKLRSVEAGNTSIEFAAFPYLNRLTESVDYLSSKELSIQVGEITSIEGGESYALLDSSVVSRHRDWFYPSNPWIYLFLIPCVLAVLIILLLKGFRKGPFVAMLMLLILSSSLYDNNYEQYAQAEQLWNEENYSAALDIYKSIEAEVLSNSFYCYNRSLLEWKSENPGEAQYWLRSALKLRPGDRRFIYTLQRMDEELGLNNQYQGTLFLRQNLFLILFISGSVLLTLAIIAHLLKNRTKTILLLFGALGIWLLSFFGNIYILFQNRAEQVVVMNDQTPMRKIWGDLAKDWILLPEGSSLEVITTHENYSFVKTGYGLEGWVEDSQLTRLRSLPHER